MPSNQKIFNQMERKIIFGNRANIVDFWRLVVFRKAFLE